MCAGVVQLCCAMDHFADARAISAKKIMKISLLPLIFPLAYTVAALALLSVGAHKTATHAEAYKFMDRGFDCFNHKFKYGRAESWTAMLAFGCVLLILGILSFLHSVALTRRDVRRQAARAAKASRGILHPSASRLLLEFGVTSWMYAGLISLMVVGLLASQSGALGFSVYDSLRRSEWSSATWTTSILHFEMRLFLRPRSSSYAFVQTLAATPLTFMAFYVRFIGALINMCTIAVGPTIIVACLYPSCRVTCVYLLPQLALLCTAWVAFRSIVLTESASNPWWYNPIVNENHPLAVLESTFHRHDDEGGVVDRVGTNFHAFFTWIFSFAAGVGVLVESLCRAAPPATLTDGDGRERSHRCAAVAAGATAFLVPHMCFWGWNILHVVVFGQGEPWGFRYNRVGALWYKSDEFTRVLLRIFFVNVMAVGFAYVAKCFTQKQLLCIPLPFRTGELRFVAPLYFLAFWGAAGRIMQSS